MKQPREPKEREIDYAGIAERVEVIAAERDALAAALEALVRAWRGESRMDPAVVRAQAVLVEARKRRRY